MSCFTAPGLFLTPVPSLRSRRKSTTTIPTATPLNSAAFRPQHKQPQLSHTRSRPVFRLRHTISNPALRCDISTTAARKPEPLISSTSRKSRKNNIFLTTVSIAGCLLQFGSGSGSGSGFSGGGGGGGGGGGDGGKLWRILSIAYALDEQEFGQEWNSHGLPANILVQLSKLSAFKKYKISEIFFFDRFRSETLGTEDSLFQMVSLRPGGVYTKAQLQEELETLATSGMFDEVAMEGKTNPDGTIGLTISFLESTWQSADRFRCINVGLMQQPKPIEIDEQMTDKEKMDLIKSQEKDYKRRIEKSRPCLLPAPIYRELMQMLKAEGKVSARTMHKIMGRVLKWYHDEGYVFANVGIRNLSTKEVVCEVVEGDITQLVIKFEDKLGNVVEGNTNLAVVRRELPKQLRQGHVFNIKASQQALRNIFSLDLFSNIEVIPRRDEKNEGGVIVEIKLKESEQKTADFSTEWSIVPGREGRRPTLASIQPGGTVSFEHRNLGGLNRSILGSVTTSNLINPQDDLAFKLEYVHPYFDGVYNPRNRTLKASCFNSRKMSPVFTGGPGFDEVPPIWVDRAGCKAIITEKFNRQSEFKYGIVMEEITTRDYGNDISRYGQRVLPNGGISPDGPPTTLSGTGIDRMAFAQANITRDNTRFVNGAIVGERNVFQVDQGLGIGSKFPLFNRHQLTVTKFIQLKDVDEEGAGKPQPPVLVLHGHYGGCIGDLPSYDAFTLGGPYSVRGYNMGELGAARNILEVAAEIRVPVKNTHVYAFVEHGNDLGSSKDVKGNPTEVYRRMGSGSSYGVGAKLGSLRAEYAVDHNSASGAFFFRVGDRF
ncbi:hypothetical protein QQ045_032434 [Rhodiola kirilowii]